MTIRPWLTLAPLSAKNRRRREKMEKTQMEKIDSIFKCPRAGLAMGIGALGLLGMALAPAIAGVAQSQAAAAGAFAALVAALLGCAAFLAWRLTARIKTESFDEGMRLVMETAPTVCNLFDKDSNLVYCNDKALKLYGFRDRQEYYKKYASTLPELQPDGSRSADMAVKFIRNVMDGGTGLIEWCQKTSDGELLPLRITGVSAVFQGKQHMLEYTQDLRAERETERQKEEAVRERMRAIMDSAPMLCIVYDENGNALEVNREAESLFGISDRKVFAERFRDFLPARQPDGSDSMQKNVDTMRQTLREGHMRYEWMYRRADGSPLPTEEIMTRIELDDQTRVIAYSRDLRESHARRAEEQAAQKKLHDMTDRLNGQLETQSAAITESSAAIEEMVANIRSVSNTLSRNAANVKDLQEASEVGHSGLSEVAADIREIARESESLLEINAVMQNIASQTNLLSMNAAIEAAHAGESGRGFAVVADEIRKLAESSSAQSKTIGAALKKIKGSIDKITRSTDNVLNRFKAIDDGVKTVAEQESVILGAMEEQGKGGKQVLEAIGQVNDITNQVKDSSRQMLEEGNGA